MHPDLAEEINALDENFYQFYYACQYNWLQREEINFQAVQSLWDLLNNLYDNLDDMGITLESLGEALQVVETMNDLVREMLKGGTPSEEGVVFSGTREAYRQAGGTLLEMLYRHPCEGSKKAP